MSCTCKECHSRHSMGSKWPMNNLHSHTYANITCLFRDILVLIDVRTDAMHGERDVHHFKAWYHFRVSAGVHVHSFVVYFYVIGTVPL